VNFREMPRKINPGKRKKPGQKKKFSRRKHIPDEYGKRIIRNAQKRKLPETQEPLPPEKKESLEEETLNWMKENQRSGLDLVDVQAEYLKRKRQRKREAQIQSRM